LPNIGVRYYPFGLKHNGYNSVVTSTNPGQKIKFQGQERQDELGLNWDSFKWRNYDYAIGRFINIDPLCEKYSTWTPYAFSGNRVVDSRELEGLEPIKPPTPTQLTEIQICTGTTNCANERLAPEGYTNPQPYTPNSTTKLYEGGTESYVRLSTDGVTQPQGRFVVRPEVIEGKSPVEIQELLAMPNTPTHITDVNAQGASMVEGPVNGSSVKGTMQNEILNRLPAENFTNTRLIPEMPVIETIVPVVPIVEPVPVAPEVIIPDVVLPELPIIIP